MISRLTGNYVFRETQYGSFQEAVDASVRLDRTARARQASEVLSEATAVDYEVHATAVEILLRDGRLLLIHCAGDLVEWKIVEHKPIRHGPRWWAEEVALTLPEGRVLLWKPEALLHSRLNATGISITATETLVFLGVRGLPELMFCQIAEVTGGRSLYFEEE